MKVFWFVLQWACIGASVRLIIYLWKHPSLINRPVMPGALVLFFGLSLAFTWVEKLKWGVTKPFNCVPCMTGWLSLLLAIVFHTEFWYLYLPAGLLVGSVFSTIKMRWL
jgi:hypothetical protein